MKIKIIAVISIIALILIGLYGTGFFTYPWYSEEIPPEANVGGDWNVKLSFKNADGNWIEIPKNRPLSFLYGDVEITEIRYTLSASISGYGYNSVEISPVGTTVEVDRDWYLWSGGAWVYKSSGWGSCLCVINGIEQDFNGNTVTIPVNSGNPEQIFYNDINLLNIPVLNQYDGQWKAQIYVPDTAPLPQISYNSIPSGISGILTVPKIVLYLEFTKTSDTLTFSWSAGVTGQ